MKNTFRKTMAAIAAASMITSGTMTVSPVMAKHKVTAKKTKKKKAGVKLSGIPKAAKVGRKYTLKAKAKGLKGKVKYKFTYKLGKKSKTLKKWSKSTTAGFKTAKSGVYKFTVTAKGKNGSASGTLKAKFGKADENETASSAAQNTARQAPAAPAQTASSEPSGSTPAGPVKQDNSQNSKSHEQTEQGKTDPEQPVTPVTHKYNMKVINPSGSEVTHYSKDLTNGGVPGDAFMIFVPSDEEGEKLYLVDQKGNKIKNNDPSSTHIYGLFADVHYKKDPEHGNQIVQHYYGDPVEGGYLFVIGLLNAGTYTLHLEDADGNKLDSNEITLTVVDRKAEESKQIDSLIVTALNASPSSVKHATAQEWINDNSMDAISKTEKVDKWMSSTQKNDGGFDLYPSTVGIDTRPVASHLLSGEWWDSHEITDNEGAEIIRKVAIRLGISPMDIIQSGKGGGIYCYSIYTTPEHKLYDEEGNSLFVNIKGWPSVRTIFTNDATLKNVNGYTYFDMLDLTKM